jgi:BioD-like phosphotransacetylase family protein
LISSGGIGRPIDEIILNKALFDREGVKLLGVIINKVLPQKFDKINGLVRKGLTRKGIDVLGVVPYDPVLSRFTFEQILEEAKYQLLSGKGYVENHIAHVVIGAMQPQDAVKYIIDDSLLITPGDREDILKIALETARASDKESLRISGVVLTGGITPGELIMNALRQAKIPVLLAKEDTYTVASTIHDMTVKVRSCDKDKIERIITLIRNNVDIDAILKGM